MENEFFSMLLNFDSGSFQSVPDIVRQNPAVHPHHHHPVDVNQNKNLPNTTQLSNVTKNLLASNHQLSLMNEVNSDNNNYPLDMQFPNILRNEKVEKKTQKKTKSTPKKRKQDLPNSELEQGTKQFKSSNNDDYDDYDKDCSDQEETSKRQRRLVKNREAAQLFRQRQKAYIQNLEKKVNDLNFENQQHRSKVELLTTENRLLADQLTYLRSFISGVISIAFPNGQPHNLAAMLPPFDVPPRMPDMPRSDPNLPPHPMSNPKDKLN